MGSIATLLFCAVPDKLSPSCLVGECLPLLTFQDWFPWRQEITSTTITRRYQQQQQQQTNLVLSRCLSSSPPPPLCFSLSLSPSIPLSLPSLSASLPISLFTSSPPRSFIAHGTSCEEPKGVPRLGATSDTGGGREGGSAAGGRGVSRRRTSPLRLPRVPRVWVLHGGGAGRPPPRRRRVASSERGSPGAALVSLFVATCCCCYCCCCYCCCCAHRGGHRRWWCCQWRRQTCTLCTRSARSQTHSSRIRVHDAFP